MDKIINIIEKIDTTNYTLILPSVAVGNVGQLAIDLLISTYRFKKYATVWHPSIIPLVGGDPFFNDPLEISTACELFIQEELQLVVMQIRSGIETKLALSFFSKLNSNLAQFNFKQIVILTSAFAHELHNINLSHYRFISNNSDLVSKFDILNILRMEENENESYVIFGGGFAVKLYEVLRDGYLCTILVKYTSEGDNQPDALEMVNILYRLLDNFHGKISTTVSPSSWQYAFGNPPPIGIY